MHLFEYGKELGARGYSSCVSAKEIQQNGNIVVHLGDCAFDKNRRAIAGQPGGVTLSIRKRALRLWETCSCRRLNLKRR
ncbi:aryl-sulfate sulfotransferase, partial [Acinetobacter baumannii]|uniref:aryl-sulfate sulfotransferase n=1 Tax=Acinetobacter baumannii TaxID=470 RepID=UPI002FE212EC